MVDDHAGRHRTPASREVEHGLVGRRLFEVQGERRPDLCNPGRRAGTL